MGLTEGARAGIATFEGSQRQTGLWLRREQSGRERDGINKREAHAPSHNFMQPEKPSASREQHSNFRTRRTGKLRSLQFASGVSRVRRRRRRRSADWHGRGWGGVSRAGLRFDKIQCLLNQESKTAAVSKEESPNRLSAPRGGMQPWQSGVVLCGILSVWLWMALTPFLPCE